MAKDFIGYQALTDSALRGVVRDARLYDRVEKKMREAVAHLHLTVQGWWPSAIAGGDGNHEFLLAAERGS